MSIKINLKKRGFGSFVVFQQLLSMLEDSKISTSNIERLTMTTPKYPKSLTIFTRGTFFLTAIASFFVFLIIAYGIFVAETPKNELWAWGKIFASLIAINLTAFTARSFDPSAP